MTPSFPLQMPDESHNFESRLYIKRQEPSTQSRDCSPAMALPMLDGGQVDGIASEKSSYNLSCLNAIIQMLRSIPSVLSIFTEQSYRAAGTVQEVCDELHHIFTSQSRVDARKLRRYLKEYADNERLFFAKHQNLEQIFFQELFKLISTELVYSCPEVQSMWSSFVAGTVTFLEIEQSSNCGQSVALAQHLNQMYGNSKLPDFLMIKMVWSLQGSRSPGFPENRMTLVNGDTFTLSCIIDKGKGTGRYSAAVVEEGVWRRHDPDLNRIVSLTASEVKTHKNYIFLYRKEKSSLLSKKKVRFMEVPSLKENNLVCPVKDCPDDRKFTSRKSLDSHIKREHRQCGQCREIFLMEFLYRAHLKYCHGQSATDGDDSGMESMHGDADARLSPEVQAKDLKRKICPLDDVWGALEPEYKRPHIAGEDLHKQCENPGCRMVGPHWCLYPPVTKEDGWLAASGTILREKSILHGIPYFVDFNNSFMKNLGCKFCFKNGTGSIKVESYCMNTKRYKYELKISGDGVGSSIKGVVGERRKVALFKLSSSILFYDLKVKEITTQSL